jgi:hypothetical protein
MCTLWPTMSSPLMGAYQIIITRRFTSNGRERSLTTMRAGKLIRSLSIVYSPIAT